MLIRAGTCKVLWHIYSDIHASTTLLVQQHLVCSMQLCQQWLSAMVPAVFPYISPLRYFSSEAKAYSQLQISMSKLAWANFQSGVGVAFPSAWVPQQYCSNNFLHGQRFTRMRGWIEEHSIICIWFGPDLMHTRSYYFMHNQKQVHEHVEHNYSMQILQHAPCLKCQHERCFNTCNTNIDELLNKYRKNQDKYTILKKRIGPRALFYMHGCSTPSCRTCW